MSGTQGERALKEGLSHQKPWKEANGLEHIPGAHVWDAGMSGSPRAGSLPGRLCGGICGTSSGYTVRTWGLQSTTVRRQLSAPKCGDAGPRALAENTGLESLLLPGTPRGERRGPLPRYQCQGRSLSPFSIVPGVGRSGRGRATNHTVTPKPPADPTNTHSPRGPVGSYWPDRGRHGPGLLVSGEVNRCFVNSRLTASLLLPSTCAQ